jgi:sodium transport system permease protein
MPLLFQFMGFVMKTAEKRAGAEAVDIAVAKPDNLPGLLNALAGAKFKIVNKADARSAVEKKEAAAGVEASALPDGRAEVVIYTDSTRPASQVAADRIGGTLDRFKENGVRIKLHEMGVPERVYSPFTVKRVNTARGQRMTGFVWGSLLGYVVVLLMFSGGMYPAIDLTAGEKERRTLEVLLAAPAGRNEIILGKLLATTSAVLITAILALGSMAVSLRHLSFGKGSAGEMGQLGPMPIDAGTLVLVAAALVPTAIMGASLMIVIALFAKSFKEAQSYLTPLVLAAVFPLMAGMLPGLQLTPTLALIPLFNVCQLIKEIFLGEYNHLSFAVTVASNTVYAVIAFLAAVQIFKNERVLFRS